MCVGVSALMIGEGLKSFCLQLFVWFFFACIYTCLKNVFLFSHLKSKTHNLARLRPLVILLCRHNWVRIWDWVTSRRRRGRLVYWCYFGIYLVLLQLHWALWALSWAANDKRAALSKLDVAGFDPDSCSTQPPHIHPSTHSTGASGAAPDSPAHAQLNCNQHDAKKKKSHVEKKQWNCRLFFPSLMF